MFARFRIPITAITLFGASTMLALSVGVVMYLGFSQATETTRQLWAERAEALIDAMEQGLDARLRPIRDQAQSVARDIRELSDTAYLDAYFRGVLAATPQIAGIAVITLDGKSRRWHRDRSQPIEEDWSRLPWINDYIRQVEAGKGPAWRAPIFTDTVGSATLLHDVPLYDTSGQFIGIFAQIVTVKELSSILARNHSASAATPFVLYDREYVLAHPAIERGSIDQPLARIDEIGDPVLEQIWTTGDDADFITPALAATNASGVFRGDHHYLYLYRNLEHYGPKPWTIGVYLDSTMHTAAQLRNLRRAMGAGLAVLLLAVAGSIYVGRKVSSPIKAIARAADAVDANRLDAVEPLGSSRIRELDEAGHAFNKMVSGLRERRLIRETLGRFVPEKVASSLLSGGGELPVQQTEATILFCDIEAFTQLTETLGPARIVDLLNAYFSAMVDILERHEGVVTQFQGDAILATFNVPIADPKHAENALRAACEMLATVARERYRDTRINIRIGINTGEVVAGAIGARGRLNYTVHGDAVNLAARLEALNKDYGSRLLLSESTAALVDYPGLIEVGETTVRGRSGSIRLFSVDGYQPCPAEEPKP